MPSEAMPRISASPETPAPVPLATKTTVKVATSFKAEFNSPIYVADVRGEFRPIPVDAAVPALIAPSLLLALHKHSVGACPMCHAFPQDESQVIETQIDLVLDGLCRRPGGADPKDPA